MGQIRKKFTSFSIIGLSDKMVEMLFVLPSEKGEGYGLNVSERTLMLTW